MKIGVGCNAVEEEKEDEKTPLEIYRHFDRNLGIIECRRQDERGIESLPIKGLQS